LNIVLRKQKSAWRRWNWAGAGRLWISGLLGRFVLLCLGVAARRRTLVTATVTPAIVDEIGGIAYVSWTILLYQIGAIVAGPRRHCLPARWHETRPIHRRAAVWRWLCNLRPP
jgi:hypothetical protein